MMERLFCKNRLHFGDSYFPAKMTQISDQLTSRHFINNRSWKTIISSVGKLINYVQSLKTVLEPSRSYVILSLGQPSTRELRCRGLSQNKRSIIEPPFAAPEWKKTHVSPTSKKFRGSRESSKKAASCRCENEPNKPLWGLALHREITVSPRWRTITRHLEGVWE